MRALSMVKAKGLVEYSLSTPVTEIVDPAFGATAGASANFR